MRGWIITLVACIAVAGTLGYYKTQQIQAGIAMGRSFPEPVEAVEAFIVREELWQPATSVTGEVLATRSVSLSNELAGTIVEVGFLPGGGVSKGQMLIRLDAREEQAQLAAARAEADIARLEFNRFDKLIATGAVPQESRDQSKARFEAAIAMVQRLQTVIDKKTLRAPFAARSGLHQLEPGLYLEKGTVITRLIGGGESLWIDFFLPQGQAQLVIGQAVLVQRSDRVGEAEANIIARDAFISETSRNIRYRALLNSPELGLVAGSLVSVRVPLGDSLLATVVPITAVRRDAFGARVFVLQPSEEGARAPERAGVRLVKLGPQRGDLMIVSEGLRVGERVAANGAFKLREGVLVNARQVDQALSTVESDERVEGG